MPREAWRRWRRWSTGALGAALFGAVCALVPVGNTATAATSEVGSTVVTFSVAPAIEVTAWPQADLTLASDAVPGTPVISSPLTITVKSNAEWGVRIQSDTATGGLREFDATAQVYITNGLQIGPVEWATDLAGPWVPLNPTPTPVLSLRPPTGENGETVTLYLRLTPDFDVRPLDAGRVYRMVLTFTAGVGY